MKICKVRFSDWRTSEKAMCKFNIRNFYKLNAIGDWKDKWGRVGVGVCGAGLLPLGVNSHTLYNNAI